MTISSLFWLFWGNDIDSLSLKWNDLGLPLQIYATCEDFEYHAEANHLMLSIQNRKKTLTEALMTTVLNKSLVQVLVTFLIRVDAPTIGTEERIELVKNTTKALKEMNTDNQHIQGWECHSTEVVTKILKTATLFLP